MGRGHEPSRLIDEAGSPLDMDGSPADAAPAPKIAVLVVDDESLIRDVAQTALEDGGYAVRVANNGPAAISILEEPDAEHRALVTDIVLGRGPSGWDLARRAREIFPGLAVVYMTGGNEHEYAAQRVPGSTLVSKPFAADQIVGAVAAVVAGRKQAKSS